jgi:hypothetical protein
MATPKAVVDRANLYFQQHSITGVEFDSGTQGHIWRTSRQTAVKIHIYGESYLAELAAYMRLRDRGIDSSEEFIIPRMLHYNSELLAIEMQIVFPPYIVDFASARLDIRPDLIEDEGHTFHDRIRDRFGSARAQKVIDICDDLAARAGIYLLDPHPGNIKFASEPTASGSSDGT